MNFEDILEVSFQNKELLEEALTHSSYANEHNKRNNERLEYLGDAVLELCMSEYLFRSGEKNEGEMTKKRAQAVCEEALVKYAKVINLSSYIKLGHGEELSGGRCRDAIIADAFEALLGAIFLDQGFLKAQEFFNRVIVPNIVLAETIKDYKSTLQEHVQADKRELSYEIVGEDGPAHNKRFEAIVRMDGCILGRGSGHSKKEAEQNAAKMALEKLVKEVNDIGKKAL